MQAGLQTIGALGGATPSDAIGASTDQAVSGVARIPLGELAALTIQVGLAVFLIRQFQIEGRGFFVLSLLCGGGFVVHALLPFAYRLPFFVLLSLAAVFAVLGPVAGAWLVGVSLLMIGLCHLPITFARRVAVLLAAGVGLAVVRAGWVVAPWPRAVWPILGSMLMFRLIIYLYDLRHDATPRSVWQTLAYFFLLPNVCFALFPLVDFKTWRRTYYDAPAQRIYQLGVHRMTRGIGHLLLYRLVYHHWVLAPAEVTSPGLLVQFLVTNFALYLRVSGTFHLIAGMLHLFGFHLPDTHYFYFLATSIGDLWRRINIYWKDFMQKLVFYPTFFALRRHGTTPALLLATLSVVVITWLLHSYQWFWIGGSFPLTWQDATFWVVIGLLMLLQNVYLDHPQRRRAAASPTPLMRLGIHGVRIAATFTLMCMVWSLWTCESFADWLSVWAVFGAAPGPVAAGVSAAVLVFYLAAVMLPAAPPAAERVPGGMPSAFWPAAGLTAGMLAAFGVLSVPAIFLPLGSRVSALIHTMRTVQLNRLDAAKMQRGYYEDLFNIARLDSPLWEVEAMKPPDWRGLRKSAVARETRDLREYELVPSTAMIFKGAPFHVNRLGIRDREYTRDKPPGTYRIALLGSSNELGAGVADHETFENLVEDRLNRDRHDQHYELLNFAVAAYSAVQAMVTLERRVFDVAPDAVFYFAHPGEAEQSVKQLSRLANWHATQGYPFLANLLRDANVDSKTPEAIRAQRLRGQRTRLLEWAYRRIVQLSRAHGAKPVWVFLPLSNRPIGTGMEDEARRAGFTTVDLSGAYDGYDDAALRVAAWDEHPNAVAHQLLADRLYSILAQRPELLAPDPQEGRAQAHTGQ